VFFTGTPDARVKRANVYFSRAFGHESLTQKHLDV
jgi:hypothetical protein